MVNEASTMEPGCNGGDSGGGSVVLVADGVASTKESVVLVAQLQQPLQLSADQQSGGDQGVQLRSSARVSKKLKLDTQAAAATAASLKKVSDLEEKVPTLQASPVSVSVASTAGTATTATPSVGGTAAAVETQRPKGRRANETSLWSMDDKNAFFESLNEFGKDFEAIHHHIEVKARKRGEQEPKSRDQVRHFYYRTWNKISKHLRFPDGTAKATQELYGLINYGEMRKKIGYPYTAKNSHKLKELIFLGSTQIRIKGKTWRIKTPTCKALRKLNALEDCCEEVKLPPRVTVELRPRDNRAWAHVQSLAYNPRVCAELSLNRRLGSLIAHLQTRWRSMDDKRRQTLTVNDNSTQASNSTGTNSSTLTPPNSQPESAPDMPSCNDILPMNDSPTDLPNCSPPTSSLALANLLAQTDDVLELCVAPQQGAQMVEASFKMSAIATSAKLSFLSYTDRQGKDYRHILTEAASKNTRMRAGALKRQRSDSSCEKGGSLTRGAADGYDRELLAADAADQLELQLAEHCELMAPNADLVFHQQQQASLSDDGGAGGPLGDSSSTSPLKGDCDLDQDVADGVEVAVGGHESVAERQERMATFLQKMQSGWTVENAGTTRIGQLYVMLGNDSRMVLEYWWRKKGDPDDEIKVDQPTNQSSATPVTTALQKLVSLAKLTYRKTRVSCPCGHVCNQPTDAANPAATANPVAKGVARVRGASASSSSSSSSSTTASSPSPSSSTSSSKVVAVGETQVQAPQTAAPGKTSVPGEGVFRKPVLAPLRPKADTVDQFKFKAQLDKFKLLRYCNRRGRNARSKNVVVPRILPLLPKVPADKELMFKLRPVAAEGGEGVPPGGVVEGGEAQKSISSTKEVAPQPVLTIASQLISFTPTTVAANFGVPLTNNHLLVPVQLSQTLSESAVTLESSEIADLSPNTKEDETNKEMETLDVPKPRENVMEDEPPPSPMGLLKEEMLINTDDYSLSSLLGHLESPDKSCSAAFGDDHRHITDVSCDDSRLPDVDAQLQSLMCEDSVDYMGKFADLAAKLTSDSLSHDDE